MRFKSSLSVMCRKCCSSVDAWDCNVGCGTLKCSEATEDREIRAARWEGAFFVHTPPDNSVSNGYSNDSFFSDRCGAIVSVFSVVHCRFFRVILRVLVKPALTLRRISSLRTHDDAQDCVAILMKWVGFAIFCIVFFRWCWWREERD